MLENLPAPAATALRTILLSVVRHVITAIGIWLVSYGYLDQNVADSIVSPVVDQVMGVILALVSLSWSTISAAITHSRYMDAWLVLTGQKTSATDTTKG